VTMTSSEQGTNLRYQVRFTWESLNGVPHPRFTYQPAESETRAIDVAVAAVDRMAGNISLRLVEVHWRHIGSQQWTSVQ
jgi:hypothetical protein